MSFLGELAKKTPKVPKPENFGRGRIYDYSTEENRINTATWLFDQAKRERNAKEHEWQRYNDYYNDAHDVRRELIDAMEDTDQPLPPVVPDPYIQVESQIDPDVPEPEFHGRDNDKDGEKAEKRQKAVKFVCDNNRIDYMNTRNERRLRKFGDAWWKAWWDANMPCGMEYGDIRLKDVALEDVYVDPIAETLDDAEYVAYLYTVHKNEFWRLYGQILRKRGMTLDDVTGNQYRKGNRLFEDNSHEAEVNDDRVQILELWFKQIDDGKDHEAGDIACTIQAGNIELRYIPRYWEKTYKQNKLYPFVHYWCIGDETGFYNRSELQPILSLVDTADRELAIGVENDNMCGNDIILHEEGALATGEEINNVPGSVVRIKKGMINAVRRLGGLNNGIQSTSMVEWAQGQIQRASRNYDINNGQETSKVTTASGLLQLRSDAAEQGKLKKADRNNGFCRLYELIDWLCLEFYTDDRLLYLGIDKETGEQKTIRYNSMEFAVTKKPIEDMLTGEQIIPEEIYFPRIDVTVTCGDGIGKNPASTVQVLDSLAAVQVTADNWELIAAELEYLDIPQKQKIIEGWRKKYGSGVPEEVIAALQNNPQLLEAVAQMAQGTQGQQPTSPQLDQITDVPGVNPMQI